MWGVSSQELKIILNRVPADFHLPGLSVVLDAFIASTEAAEDEKLICSEIKKWYLSGKNRLMLIAENESIRQPDTLVNPRTLLGIDIPEDLRNVIDQILC